MKRSAGLLLCTFKLNRVLQFLVVMSACWTYQDIRVEATTCDCGVDCVSNCTAGQYWDNGSCTDCQAGHYCPGDQHCSLGVSCMFPCPTGTYTPVLGARSEDGCLPCPPGSYCQTPGLVRPTGECDPGWFCTTGAKSAQPGTVAEGGRCSPGQFCPRGSSVATPCTPGMYCDNHGLAEPTGNCIAGYYCLLGARIPNPYDPLGNIGTGDICPRGYYCPEGSSYKIPCPPGTFSNQYGNRELGDCLVCTMGSYCAGYENTGPSGLCDAGYYCPGGQRTPTPVEYVCSPGNYCTRGSGTPQPCPKGTYSNVTGLTTAEECSPCPSDRYCETEGLTEPTGAACGAPGIAVGNSTEFSPAPVIAVSVVAGVAVVLAVTVSILYIGNRLELRKVQAAQPQLGRDGSYKSIPEHQYEAIPATVGGPPPMPPARALPVRHNDIELQATRPGMSHQGEGAGGLNGRMYHSRQPWGTRVPTGSPWTLEPDSDTARGYVFENDGESDMDEE